MSESGNHFPGAQDDPGRRGLGEQIDTLEKTKQEIAHDRHRDGRAPGLADDEPDGDLPGPHARLLACYKHVEKDESGEPHELLVFNLILPNQSYGYMVVLYPVPEPKEFLRDIFAFCGIDPSADDIDRNLERLFKKDVPIRPVPDATSKQAWMLDLPPNLPKSRQAEDGVRGTLGSKIPQGSNTLYRWRRRAEEEGLVTWKGEQYPGKRLISSSGAKQELAASIEELCERNRVGIGLSSGPQLTWKARVGFYSLPLVAIFGGVFLGLMSAVAGGMVALLVAVLLSYLFLTYSVRRYSG